MLRSSLKAKSWRHDIAFCRALLANGSRSFFAASFLLPKRVREPATALYAFCRLADDCVDVRCAGLPSLDGLRSRLDRIYRGVPVDFPVDRALAGVVDRHAIPRALPEALLEGLEWDATGRRYATLADLHAYSARVAGSVGVMMALLMGVRAPDLLARAADLGVAMQLTNIARDVGEDARAGRLYLPLDWLDDAGVDVEAWLAQPVFTPALGDVVTRVLDAADALYRRADAGIAALPTGCRVGIAAARLLYSEIGAELRRNGLDSVSRRSVVPLGRKMPLLLRSVGLGSRSSIADSHCLEQTRFLIDAIGAEAALPVAASEGGPVWWDARGRAIWVIGLFEQLQRRQVGNVTAATLRASA